MNAELNDFNYDLDNDDNESLQLKPIPNFVDDDGLAYNDYTDCNQCSLSNEDCRNCSTNRYYD